MSFSYEFIQFISVTLSGATHTDKSVSPNLSMSKRLDSVNYTVLIPDYLFFVKKPDSVQKSSLKKKAFVPFTPGFILKTPPASGNFFNSPSVVACRAVVM